MAMKRIARRSLLAASAAFTAFGIAPAAHAQDEAPQTGTQTADTMEDSNEQNILVTVQRREQTLLTVPASVSVVSDEALERQAATNFLEYVNLVPGLNVTQASAGLSRVIIRGINTQSVASTVSVYVDDVPFGSSGSLSNGGIQAGDFDTFDIARIEVLRGPQGTLYGSNSLGGTIKFVTAEPAIGRWEARGQAGVEFVDDGGTGWTANGLVNVPIADTLAVRASGFYRRDAGFIDAVGRSEDNINDVNSYGGRASLLFEPSDTLSVRLFALVQNIRADSPSTYEVNPVTLEPVNALTGLPSEDRTRFQRIAENTDVDYRLYSGTIGWDTGIGTLTSVTSYAELRQDQFTDISNTGNRGTANLLYALTAPGTVGLAFQNDVATDKFTQELRLAGESGPIEWLLGGYYTREEGQLFQRFQPFSLATEALLPTAFALPFPFGGLPAGTQLDEFVFVTLDSDYEEIAGFASATWHISDRFDITAGGRYSHNDQSSEQFTSIIGTEQTINGESSEGVFTWSVAPLVELNDRVSLYARVAKGYRPGGPNAVPPGAPPTFPASFEADTLVSYEVGVRGSTADRTLSVDASIFNLDWDNILINTVFIDPATGTQFGANGNGRRARSTGFEVAATLVPMRGLNINANFAYTDARLLDDTTPADGAVNLTGGLAGDRLPYVPELAGNLAVDYDWALSGSATAYVGANLRIVGDQAAGFDAAYRTAFGRRLTIDGYETIDLRAGVDVANFSVQAFVRNLTNSDGLVNAGGFPRQIPPVVGGTNVPLATAASIAPRTFGLTLGYRY
jgi:iron complex outermembrane recepter protein